MVMASHWQNKSDKKPHNAGFFIVGNLIYLVRLVRIMDEAGHVLPWPKIRHLPLVLQEQWMVHQAAENTKAAKCGFVFFYTILQDSLDVSCSDLLGDNF